MKLTHRDWEGYGVYEFMSPVPTPTVYSGYSQFPGLSIPGGMPDPATMMVDDGGIQVLKSEYQDMAMSMLDQTTLDLDNGENDPMVTGQANAILGTFGDGWATDFLQRGYCIMMEIATVQTGSPIMMMANAPGYISDNARVGGAYAVVKCPGSLLQQAKALVAGQPSIPGTNGGNGNGKPGVDDLDCAEGEVIGPVGTQWDGQCLSACPPGYHVDGQGFCQKTESGDKVTKAEAGLPGWVWPVALGVGAVALVAFVTAGTQQRGRR